MFSPAAELITSVPPPQAEDISRGYNFHGQKSPHLDCCIKGSHLLDSIICLFLIFFQPVGTTLSLEEEGFLSVLLLFKSLRVIFKIVATYGLFSLHNKGK